MQLFLFVFLLSLPLSYTKALHIKFYQKICCPAYSTKYERFLYVRSPRHWSVMSMSPMHRQCDSKLRSMIANAKKDAQEGAV